MGSELVHEILESWETAPIDDRLRATLTFLTVLTLSPERVGASDIEPMRSAGVSDAAIADAITVCALFCVIDRISDALDFSALTDDQHSRGARMLAKFGYRLNMLMTFPGGRPARARKAARARASYRAPHPGPT